MSSLAKVQYFNDTGNPKRERENFQGVVFSKLNFENSSIPISFYRSDFRGAKFNESLFAFNNFSNSDFIDSSILKTNFKSCKFKFSELYNSYFEDCDFTDSNFDSASLVKIVFTNCQFNQGFFIADTLRECKFSNCSFKGSIFRKNSIDDVRFENVEFENIDLSNMTAMNLFFVECTFNNVVIDADYLGSYFFKGNFLDRLKLKYRGKVFNLDISHLDLLDNLSRICLDSGRYYEVINLVIQKNRLQGNSPSLFPLLKEIFDRVYRESNPLIQSYQFEKLFDLLTFYIDTGYLKIEDYFKIIGHVESWDLRGYNFNEELSLMERMQRLKAIILRSNFNVQVIGPIEGNEKVLLEITIDQRDKLAFENNFDDTIKQIGKELEVEGSLYEIVGHRKGSLIYSIIIYTSAALLFLKLYRAVVKELRLAVNESFQLSIDYTINTKAKEHIKQLKSKNPMNDLLKIRKFQEISQRSIDPSRGENVTKEIEKLLPIIKSAVIYPNAFADSR